VAQEKRIPAAIKGKSGRHGPGFSSFLQKGSSMRRIFASLGWLAIVSSLPHQARADELLIKAGTIGSSSMSGSTPGSQQAASKETNSNYRLIMSYGFNSEDHTQYLRLSHFERSQKFTSDSNQPGSWEKGFGLGYGIRYFAPIFPKTSVFADAAFDLERGTSESQYQGRGERKSIKLGSEVGLRLQSDQSAFFELSTQLVELSYMTLESKKEDSESSTKSWSVATMGQTAMGSARLGVGFRF
jgi:hypothetical protein